MKCNFASVIFLHFYSVVVILQLHNVPYYYSYYCSKLKWLKRIVQYYLASVHDIQKKNRENQLVEEE